MIVRETEEETAREQRFRGERPPPRLANRTVIVVDDGLPTGATMRATLHPVRAQGPAYLMAAVPIGSPQACQALQTVADAVVCRYAAEPFWVVGRHYDDARPVADETVPRILQDFQTSASPPHCA